MNILVTPTYQIPLVVLSYALAVIGSLIALAAARRIVAPDGRVSGYNAMVSGLALGGVGVWSMHFIGMLATKLNMGVSYSAFESVLSLVAAIASTGFALSYVARAPKHLGRLLGAGTLLGIGVAVMHYLGMYGMRFGGFIEWSWSVVGLSVAIAVIAATTALWLAFNTHSWLARIFAALVMGAAVCAMHYTGMAAANFICTTATPRAIPDGFGVFSALELPLWVTMLTVLCAFGLALNVWLHQVREVGTAVRA